MAEPKKNPSQSDRPASQADLAGGAEFTTFAYEDEVDRKTVRWAIVGAVIFHLLLFMVQLPKMLSAVTEPKKPKVYVVQQVRFKPPPPKQQQEIPKPKIKKVPIPDPTPDEPEPLRLEEEDPEIDLPDTDLIFGVPDAPPSEPEGPIRVGGDVKPPVKLVSPSPQYTEIARKARIQGVVIVEAIIDKQGNVTNVKILKALPMGLDLAASDAVSKWHFKPATLNGKPVAVIYNLTVNFRLQ